MTTAIDITIRRLYVASAFAERARAAAAVEEAKALGFSVPRDWTLDVDLKGAHAIERAALANLKGVREADRLIVLLPEDPQSTLGLWVELGAALGSGVPVVLVSTQPARTLPSLFCALALGVVSTVREALQPASDIARALKPKVRPGPGQG